MKMDLTDRRRYFEAFIKTRVSLEPVDVMMWFTGNVYGIQPGSRPRHLFSFDGVNTGRAERTAEGFVMLSREAGIYRNPETAEILHNWINPYLDRTVRALPLLNDPVNSVYRFDGPPMSFGARVFQTEDEVCFTFDAFIDYLSPLPRRDFPENSADDIYRASELLQFAAPRVDLEDGSLPTARCSVSWVRMSQWLPWMEMGDREGGLLYHCRGTKLLRGVESLPADFRHYLVERYPQYLTAPTALVQPNETSWTYFKRYKEGAA